MTTIWPFCMFCAHCRVKNRRITCAAYPDGVPQQILLWQWDHRQPLPDDHGIQFEPRGRYPEMERWIVDEWDGQPPEALALRGRRDERD